MAHAAASTASAHKRAGKERMICNKCIETRSLVPIHFSPSFQKVGLAASHCYFVLRKPSSGCRANAQVWVAFRQTQPPLRRIDNTRRRCASHAMAFRRRSSISGQEAGARQASGQGQQSSAATAGKGRRPRCAEAMRMPPSPLPVLHLPYTCWHDGPVLTLQSAQTLACRL